MCFFSVWLCWADYTGNINSVVFPKIIRCLLLESHEHESCREENVMNICEMELFAQE